MIRVRRGLDVPIAGAARQTIASGAEVREVALLGDDYAGMRPTMRVELGERAKLGQVLFSDKKTPGVVYTSRGSGKVVQGAASGSSSRSSSHSEATMK